MDDTKGISTVKQRKDKTFKFRYDEDTERKLDALCSKTGKSKADVIRSGINELYTKLTKE